MRTTIIAAGVAVAVSAGLVAAPAADAAAHRGTTKIHVSKKHTVSLTGSLRPGVAHLRNTSSHEVVIVRQKHKKDGAARLVKLSNSDSTNSERDLYKKFDVVEVALGHSDTWVKLGRGTYFVFDGDVETYKVKNIRTVAVKGKTSNAVTPKAKKIVFGSTGKVTAYTTITRKAPIHIDNHTSRLAFGVMVGVNASATDAQVRQVVSHPTRDGIDSIGSKNSFNVLSAAVGPRHAATVTTTLGTGRYLLLTTGAFATENPRAGTIGLITVK